MAQDVKGTVKSVDVSGHKVVLTIGLHKEVVIRVDHETKTNGDRPLDLSTLNKDDIVSITNSVVAAKIQIQPRPPSRTILQEFWHNFTHNLFKPLLLFFYMGFLVPILRVKFEFPYVIYQGLTIYLLIAIGWKGGEELAELDPSVLGSVAGFMCVGFVTNFFLGI